MNERYRDWIKYVFDHEVTDPAWHFDLDAPHFETKDDEETVDLLRETFVRAREDLREYSDAQVDQGIWFLASPSCSDYMHAVRDGQVPLPKKVAAIQAVYDLYRGCFAHRCTEVVGHLNEPGAADLNGICYMFWDLSVLTYLEKAAEAEALADAVFGVLGDTIRIPHRACIEGGLHGLGHLACWHEKRVQSVIDDFLETAEIDDTLRRYALDAREGMIL